MRILSGDDLVRAARAECSRRGLPFEEPVKIRGGLITARVWTRAESLGGNVVISVNRWTGRVMGVWQNPG